MKRTLPALFVLIISIPVLAQNQFRDRAYKEKTEWIKGEEVICPASHIDENTFIDMPIEVKKAIELRKKARPGNTSFAKFEVLYDSRMPKEAQEAFQRAVDIWGELLNSTVPVQVIALWQELGPNVLGSAGAGTYYRNFKGAKKANTWYPIALAEKMAGEELNSPDDFDIVARFSSTQNWYYGTTGTPAVGQYDFTSVVLHELCHGLGFVGSLNATLTQGSYGLNSDLPVVFDTHVINDKGQNVTDTLLFKNRSTLLRNELISENLFFNSPRAKAAGGDVNPRLYAPTIFNPGSSIFHLDDKTYPAGSENSLMTYSSGQREVNYNPGRVTMGIMNDMGWRSTSILHTRLKDYEAVTEVEIKARIISDTTIRENTAMLNYVVLDYNTAKNADLDAGLANPTKVPLKRVGDSDNFTAMLPVNLEKAVVAYYFTVTDNDGLDAVAPANYLQNPYLFFVGLPDQWAPVIEYYPPTIIASGKNVSFVANVQDDYQAGIDTVYVEYTVNGVSKPSFGLRKYNPDTDSEFSQGVSDDIAYLSTDGISALEPNDIVNFRILAKDISGNETIIPTTAGGAQKDDPVVTDVYEFTATTLLEPVTEYTNNFDSPTEDFAFTGFRIDTPGGLSNGALHTENPYKNGLGLYNPISSEDSRQVFLDFDYNAIALFRKPIIIKKDSATISFDEIVLVEPGNDGAVYDGPEFWDYVIVEISTDYGGNWVQITDGYDSNAEPAWKELFSSTLSPATGSNPTSNGTPSPALYRSREINLYDKLIPEAAGVEMLLRFRLYADQWVKGWGWAIDNLAIQVPAQKPLAVEKDMFDLQISPNPTSDYLDLRAKLANTKSAEVEVFKMNGAKVYEDKVELKNNELDHRINTNSFAPGSYLLNLKTAAGQQTKRFVIVK